MADRLIISREINVLGILESVKFTADFTDLLATGVTIQAVSGLDANSVPLGASEATGAILISDVAKNLGAIMVENVTIAIGKAVQFRCRAPLATSGTVYQVVVTVVTTAGDTKTIVCRLRAQS